jgi:hypothetical protein
VGCDVTTFGQNTPVCLSLSDSYSWKNDSELHISIYNKRYRDVCYLPNVFSAGSSCYDRSTEDRHLQEYVKVVMPLLLETWREVAPGHVDSTSVVQG